MFFNCGYFASKSVFKSLIELLLEASKVKEEVFNKSVVIPKRRSLIFIHYYFLLLKADCFASYLNYSLYLQENVMFIKNKNTKKIKMMFLFFSCHRTLIK